MKYNMHIFVGRKVTEDWELFDLQLAENGEILILTWKTPGKPDHVEVFMRVKHD